MSPRRWVVAGGVALVGVAVAATAAGGFNGFGPRPLAQGQATPTPTQRPTLLATPGETLEPTAPPTPQPTAEPTKRPRSSPTAAPQPQTYVVKEGDTLSLLATRWGTSVDAIKQANGLGSDVINVGQVLVIP